MNSIDWLIEKYTIVCGLGSKELMKEHIEKAKSMHKDEMEHFFKRGMFLVEGRLWKPIDKFEENYKETFNK